MCHVYVQNCTFKCLCFTLYLPQNVTMLTMKKLDILDKSLINNEDILAINHCDFHPNHSFKSLNTYIRLKPFVIYVFMGVV